MKIYHIATGNQTQSNLTANQSNCTSNNKKQSGMHTSRNGLCPRLLGATWLSETIFASLASPSSSLKTRFISDCITKKMFTIIIQHSSSSSSSTSFRATQVQKNFRAAVVSLSFRCGYGRWRALPNDLTNSSVFSIPERHWLIILMAWMRLWSLCQW